MRSHMLASLVGAGNGGNSTETSDYLDAPGLFALDSFHGEVPVLRRASRRKLDVFTAKSTSSLGFDARLNHLFARGSLSLEKSHDRSLSENGRFRTLAVGLGVASPASR